MRYRRNNTHTHTPTQRCKGEKEIKMTVAM